MMNYTTISGVLAMQKRHLGLTEAQIARDTGISQPTVNRIFSGRHHRAAWNDIAAIAHRLGVEIIAESNNAYAMIMRRAEEVAQDIAEATQATSQLEGQGFSEDKQAEFVHQTKAELLAGPKRRLWDAP